MKLPEPKHDSAFSVEKAISQRRSVRSYADNTLSLEEVSQLLWAAQGMTGASGERSAPSAGATYPLRAYVAAGNVPGLPAGIYKYDCQAHELTLLFNGDERGKLADATRGQSWVSEAPASLIICSSAGSTMQRYPEMGERYVYMEAGHAAQNVYLQATALGLGTVAVGAFDAPAIKRMLWLMPHEEPLYIMPVGKMLQGESNID
jgi:SagB-type dehydrogenase family enzyme